jgi:type II secretory pathway pseudopilin PulG
MTGSRTRRLRSRHAGIAYLTLMLLIAGLSIIAANAVQWGSEVSRRQKEVQLLFDGREFSHALQRYANMTPSGYARAPASLEELLRDPRYPGVVRHLRRIYTDPMTGAADWVLLRDVSGLIVGMHSRSPLKPFKVTGFDNAQHVLEGEHASYQEWIFTR